MKTVTSRYKLFGGFGLMLGLNVLVGVGTVALLSKLDLNELRNEHSAKVAYSVVLSLQLLFLVLFCTQCRFIVADEAGITFYNPLLPFLKKTTSFTDFDYYTTVYEDARGGPVEAVWLVKDEKLAARFSSFYYSNYDDLLDSIKTKRRSNNGFNPFAQFAILMGWMKVKLK